MAKRAGILISRDGVREQAFGVLGLHLVLKFPDLGLVRPYGVQLFEWPRGRADPGH